MKIIPIGSISIFVNVSSKQNKIINDILLEEIAITFKSYLLELINQSRFDIDFNIDVKWRRGCIIETVTIGIILGVTYNFIKDYDKIKNNLLLITKDLKGAFLKISLKEKNKKEKKISKEIKILKDLPEDIRKYYEAGKEIYYIENKTESIHKIAIMREDLKSKISKEYLNNKTVELNDNNSKKNHNSETK